MVLPNIEEAKVITAEESLERSAEKFLEMGAEVVAVKMGEEGSTIVTSEEKIDVPSHPLEEVDPTGAGDSYDVGFIHAILEGKNLEEAARFANEVGATSVTERGGMGGDFRRF